MARKLVAALAIILMLASEGVMLGAAAPREQSKVILRTFSDGNSQEAMFYEDPGNNTSVSIKMPQRVTIIGAAVNISAQPTTFNDTINATTREDFLNMNLSNIDVNSTAGDAYFGKPQDDGFNDMSLDPKWKWRNASAYDEGNVTPGALVLSANANTTFWNATNNGSLLYQNITGQYAYSWVVTVKVNCTPTAQGQRAGILVLLSRSNWVEFSVGRNDTTTVLSRINTTNNVSLAVNSSVGAGPVWLRINRYYNNLFYFSYSTNGVNFIQNNSMNLTWISSFTTTDTSVGLDIMSGGSGISFNATFDDYNVNRYYMSGYLIAPRREYKDEVQSTQLFWNMSLGSFGTNFIASARVSPGDGDWKTLTSGLQFDFSYPKGFMFEYNVTMTGTGDSWSVPVFRQIWGNVTVKSIPTNVSLDIGNKGTADWKQPGTLGDHPTRLNITSAITNAVAAAVPDENGDVTIVTRVYSDKRGTVSLSDLAIEYVVNSPPLEPQQQAPANATWVTTRRPTLSFNVTDPDGGELWYTINITGTSSFKLDQRTNAIGWSAKSYQSGDMASYTFPSNNELSNGIHYTWSVRAYDGFAYGPWSPNKEFYVDDSPPEGWVIDDGTETTNGTSLHANLTITDPDSGILGYEVWVGTSRNGTDIVPPTAVTSSSVVFGNLTLIFGYKYYFTARAQNGAGLWSQTYGSDGIGVKKGAVNHLPSVSLSYPSEGEKLTGMVRFKGNATDIDFLDLLTASVQVDSGEWMDCEGNRSWSLGWDSSRVENGPHAIRVRTSDGRAFSDTITINVGIQNVHEIQIVGAEPVSDPPRISENQIIGFSITAKDPFNRTLSYQWLVDGVPVTGATAFNYTYHTDYSSAGTHIVTVTVFISPLEVNYTWNVTVANVNRPPVAAIGAPASGTEVDAGKLVPFAATGSSDPDAGDLLNYSWDFGDGNQAGGLATTHKYNKGGRYIVTLTVTDPYTYSTTSIEVLVKEAAKAAPGIFEQYGLYIAVMAAMIVVGLAVGALAMRRKEPVAGARVAAPGKVPVPEKGTAVAQREGSARAQTSAADGRPAARPVARRPAPIADFGGVLTADDEPAARKAQLSSATQSRAVSPGATGPEAMLYGSTAPEEPVWKERAVVQEEAPIYGAAEGTGMPAWAASAATGPAYVRVEEEAQRPSWSEPDRRPVEEAPPQPVEADMMETMYPVDSSAYGAEAPSEDEQVQEGMEAPVEPVEQPMDEMTRILNMLAPPEEQAPAPAPPGEEESSGMEDVFAKLRSISEEFDAQPIAPAPMAPAPKGVTGQAPMKAAVPQQPPRKPAAPPAQAHRPAAAPAQAPKSAPAAAAAVAPIHSPVTAAASTAPRKPAVAPAPAPKSAPAAAAAVAPTQAPVAIKKRLLRCPKCQVVFEVHDTGERPLPIKCTACGTTGSLKK